MKIILTALFCLRLCLSAFADQQTTLGKAAATLTYIDGSNDTASEKQANAAIREAAAKLLKEVGNQGSVSYKELLNRPSLVALQLEAVNGERRAYAGLNLDLTTGKQFGVTDFFVDNDVTKAAVNAGADAVYMGGKAFGARAYASNFDEEEMARAVYFAHMHHVRLYITVNTLVDDSELGELAEYLRFLSNVGIDSIIVQDLGVIRLAQRIVPELPLHASTPMTIDVPNGVRLNDRVLRTLDSRLMSYAQQFFSSDAKKRIPVRALVTAKLGEPRSYVRE